MTALDLFKSQLHDMSSENAKLQEIVVERERALQTATEDCAKTHRANEENTQKIQDLMLEIQVDDDVCICHGYITFCLILHFQCV